MEVKYREEQVITSPYVTQADKMAVSLRHLADRFLKMEPKKQCFTPEEMTEMYDRITEKVCRGCSRKSECLERKKAEHWQLFYDLLCTIEGYGAELNKEMKQHLQRECIQAPRFLRESLETFQEAKRILVWNNKMVQSREGCAAQLDSFADMLCHVTRDLDASIFTDPPLAKKVAQHFKKAGIRMLSSVFFVDEHGRYEIQRQSFYQYVLKEGCARLRTRDRFWDRSMKLLYVWKDRDIMCCRVWQKWEKTDKRYLVTVFL